MGDTRRTRSRTWLFSGAAALGLLIGGAGIAAAAGGGGPVPFRQGSAQEVQEPTYTGSIAAPADDEGNEGDESAALSSLAKISPDEARDAALTAATGAPGTIALENENGSVVYSVAVGNSDVKVDAGTGVVLAVESQDEADNGSGVGEAENDAQGETDGNGENDESGESVAAPGSIDDGAELLPQAQISLDQAVAAAQSAATGAIGEVDLEHYQGTLVFNVDVGNQDVKVDASTGAVIGVGTD